MRVCGVILILAILGVNMGQRSSVRNFLGAASPQARREAMIQVGIELLVLATGVALVVIDLVRRHRRRRL